MNLRQLYAQQLRRVSGPWSRLLARFDPRHVYIGLAIALALWMVVSTLSDREHHLKTSTYDWMLTHRFRQPAPDRDIVLIDIDERSLAAMAEDYGRWPWPRDVLATVLAGVEAQGAQAVVFDMLFADADRQNPVSERAFEEAVARSRIAYFPVLRLNPANDGKSAVHADQLTGLVVPEPSLPLTGSPPTLAVVLPYFDSALRSGRLGTHNLDPDADSLIRRYRVWEDIAGYRVLSLPARMALDFGWQLPDAPSKKLQFNHKVMNYRTLSFSDVFADLMRKQRTRPQDEFRGKIVVIGSTAAGLFDSKGTPISRTDPGIDILATAIDNIKNDRFFHELSPATDMAIAALLLALMAWLCIRYSHEQLRLAFVIAPTLLLGISYLSMNLSNTFIDLTAPASMAFLYFSAVKFYSAQIRKRWAGDDWFAPEFAKGARHWIGCLATTLAPDNRVHGFETRYLNLLRTRAPNAHVTSGLGAQSGWLGLAYNGVLVATWVEKADDDAAVKRDQDEARQFFDGLSQLRNKPLPMDYHFLEEVLDVEPAAITSVVSTRDGAPSAVIGPAVDARSASHLDRVRGLVSRTVLRMTDAALS